jgi:hypothetical protein
LWLVLGLPLVSPFVAESLAADRVTVEGQGCHTYGDDQTPDDARQAALTKAKKRAVESHKSVVDARSVVENFELREAAVQSLAAGSLRNLTILNMTEEGREFCAQVRGQLDPAEVNEALARARQRAEEQAARRRSDDRRAEARESGAETGDARCSRYLPTTVRMKQALSTEADRAATRTKLTERMLLEAVKQERGVLLRSASKSLLASKNGNAQERFMARYQSQARGLVTYDVLRDEVIQEGGQDTLAMTIDAKVCVPREPLPRTVAVVETRSTRGQPVPELRNEIEAAFSRGQQFVPVHANNIPDIAITAEIINVGLIEKTLSAEDMPDGQAALAGDYYHMVTTMAGTAEFAGSGGRITRQVDARGLVNATLDKQLATEDFVKSKMTVLAERLRRRVMQTLAASTGTGRDSAAPPATNGADASSEGSLNH